MARRGDVPSRSLMLRIFFCLILCSLGFAGSASGTTLTVTNTNDSGANSLRAAITTANGDTGDMINITATGTITLLSPLPALAANMTITGPGAASLTVSGNNSSTVGVIFTINSGVTVAISGLTITKGNSVGVNNGGGILNEGTLTVNNCAILNNSTANWGGGIYNTGTLTVSNTTVSGDTAVAGGGIYVDGGTATLTNSTLSGNSAQPGQGGGMFIGTATVMVTNSTFSGNTAKSDGGGIENGGTLTLTNVTIFGNSSSTGTGGIGVPAKPTLANTIVASNTGSTGDIDGPYTDGGGNLVGTPGINLAPLGNYGGPTQTLLPLPDSPAICAGNKTGAPTTDQRGAAIASTYCSSGEIDSGAVQTNYTAIKFTNKDSGLGGYAADVNTAVSFPAAPIVSVTENGQNIGGVSVTLTFSGAGTATGLEPVTTVAGTGATFSSISVNAAGSDTLDAKITSGTATLTDSANLKVVSITLSPTTLQDATQNATYSQTITASGGSTSTYTYAVTSGSLPGGLGLNATTGVLSGTPATQTTASFTITATDSNGLSGRQAYTLEVNPPVKATQAIATETLTVGQSGVNFTPVTGSGGTPPLGYGISPSLPAGLTLNTSNGAITGTPTAASPQKTYTINVTDLNTARDTATFSLTVNKFTPTISVTNLAGLSSTYGQAVTFTATVTGTSATGITQPSGTVTFKNGSATITCTNSGGGTLTQGSTNSTATCTTAALTGGSHSITATYVPGSDPNYNPAGPSAAFMQTVTPVTPTVVITPVAGYSNQMYGTTLNFTATVAGPAGTGIVAPTGTVLFSDSVSPSTLNCNITLGSSSGSSSTAVCSVSTLSVATHQISATYAPAVTDPNYKQAASTTPVPATIVKATPSVSVTNLAGPTSTFGSAVTFTATVANTSTASGLTQPTGTVTFKDGSNAITCSNTNSGILTPGINNSVATCTTSALSAGSHQITVTYAPATTDLNYNAAGPSTSFAQTVGHFTPAISVSGLPNPSTYGGTITFTATVTGANGQPQPTGSVTFNDGTTALTCTNSGFGVLTPGTANSTATCNIATLTGGTHQITATYVPGSGSNYAETSPSTPFPQTVNKFTPAISVTNAVNPTSTYGQSVTFTTTVTGVSTTGAVQPTGTVTFFDGTTVLGCTGTLTQGTTSSTAACTTSTLMGGTHQITASYVPGTDLNYTQFGPSAAFTQTVNAGATNVALTSAPPSSSVNQSVIFTTVVTPVLAGATKPQGTVTLTDGLTNTTLCTVTLNPDGTVPTCTTNLTLAGTHTITAAYATSNSDYSNNSGTDNQVVHATGTMTSVTSSPATSMVNQPVTFTAAVTPNITGTAIPQGIVTFTDGLTNTTLCTVTLTSTGTVPPCPTALYVSGAHAVTATYTSSNNNFSTSSGADNQAVSATTTTTSVISSVPVSVATQSVTFTANVTPTFVGKTSPTGAVLFTLSGDNVDTCTAVPVSLPANANQPYTATCTIAFSRLLISGSVKVIATYVGDGNFVTSSGSVNQTVQNFTLAVQNSTQGIASSQLQQVTITQGFTNITDPVSPQSVTVSTASIAGFATAQGNPLTLTCNFTPLGAPANATMPQCPATQLAVSASAGAQTSAPITIDAKTATPGSYLLVVTGKDPTTGLTQMTTLPFTVNVSFFTTTPLTVASGSTTDATFNFTLPAGVSIPINCDFAIISPSLTPVPTSTIPIACTLSTTSIGSTGSTSVQSVPVTVTVNTGGAMTQLMTQTNTFLAGVLGVPVLAFIGLLARGKRPGKSFFRLLSLIILLAAALQNIGCGGNFNRTTSLTNTTPAGVYYLLVQGPGTTNTKQPYQAVIQVNVIR